jgi:flagellar basal body-associated protein FliL
MNKTNKKKKYIKYIIITALLIFITASGLIYHQYYQTKFKFKGLGDIYQTRNRQYRLFTERKITENNKGNPSKEEIKNLPSFKTRFSTSLSDGSYLSISFDFRFSDSDGIKEMRRKWERISFAASIAVSPYSGKEISTGSKDEILVIIENQIRKRIFSNIEYIYIDEFTLRN